MQHKPLPPLALLDELFEADFERGEMHWRKPRLPSQQGLAGTVTPRGYRVVKVKGNSFKMHRVLYAMEHRADPGDMEIDHLNGVFGDNRSANLRLATRDANCANRRGWRKGLRGAYKRGNQWVSIIQVRNVRQYLGSFETEEAAHEAFSNASAAAYGSISRVDTTHTGASSWLA